MISVVDQLLTGRFPHRPCIQAMPNTPSIALPDSQRRSLKIDLRTNQ
jgi:hypothetical protein